MILAVDIGNSNIVIGGIEGERLLFTLRMVTDEDKSPEAYSCDIRELLSRKNVAPESVEGAIISSVVPRVQTSVKAALEMLSGKTPLTVGPELKTGLPIRTDDPSEVGADLIVGCVAAMREHSLPLIVIDMGTATTMFAVDQKGDFIGGCIAPGIRISMDALTGNTALLPDLEPGSTHKAIGRNTIDCINSGILMGSACMLDGMVRRMEEELGEKATVVVTGGTARFVLPMCRMPVIYDPDLLLKGLMILYRENTKN